jgi:hypothetical protein
METPMTPALERVLDRLSMMRSGKFDLSWMDANPDGWGTRATPSTNGLTIGDINVGKYGVIPEHGSSHGSMAPRGAEMPAESCRSSRRPWSPVSSSPAAPSIACRRA